MSELADLATLLATDPGHSVIRVGTVEAVNAGPPLTVSIDGRSMRCLFAYSSPAVGHVVVWLDDRQRAFCLGPRL